MEVLIAFYSNLNICVRNKVNGNDGRVLILKATIDGSDYLLVNVYNANTEKRTVNNNKKPKQFVERFWGFSW